MGMLFTPIEPERRPIRVLPRDLAEKIAAGEVVERPSSVIKELVENSLDAGAKSIRVELEEGGRKKIVITDDGQGISHDELPVALERHATSKIEHLNDLWNLSTMGFRGEALPSIAAVSRFAIESGDRRLYLEGGKLIKDETITWRNGTQVTVEDLFYNVPARLKFLKARSSESAAVRELLERLALCHHKVAFAMTSEGRKSLTIPASADEAARVATVLETKPEHIEAFETQFEDITVRGWLDRDGRASNSRHIYLSVNKRMVRDKLLQQAALVALRPRMMEGEYPRLYLALELPPGDIDANVHPAKQEVRFKKTRDVFQVVHGALDQLARTPTQPFYSAHLPGAGAETGADAVTAAAMDTLVRKARRNGRDEEEFGDRVMPSAAVHQEKLFAQDSVQYKTKSDWGVADHLSLTQTPAPATQLAESSQREVTPGFQKLHYIGQLKNTYLLFQDGEGLVVIDQHAAHERINYEKIKHEFMESGLKPQPLLVSITVKCHAEDIALALDHSDQFTKLGFEFEAFGDNCLIVRSAPEGIDGPRASELFHALLDELRDADSDAFTALDPSRLSARLERVLATAACHSSVRAGQALSAREAQSLAGQMDETESSLNCPHGRPASIRLTFSQIEGLFKR